MTILSALADRYDRLAATGDLPTPGYAPAQVSFVIVLDPTGAVVRVDDIRTGDGKRRRPKLIVAPAAPKRTSGIGGPALWDKTSYVLGHTAKRSPDAQRTKLEHVDWIARHEHLLAGLDDPGCAALLAFVRGWTPDCYDTLEHAEDMLDTSIAFRLFGDIGFIHDRPAARAALLAGDADVLPAAMCLVRGDVAPIARLHPSIKGVPGAKSSGAALVSYNAPAFCSYGLGQGANAPVSAVVAFSAATALNGLLASTGATTKGRPIYPNRVMLGDTAVAFWADRGDAEQIARALIADNDDELPVDAQTETTKLRDVLQAMQEGIPLHDAAPTMDPATCVFVLGLAPNASRLSVRFWVEDTLADFAAHFQTHWADMRLDPPLPRPPSVWRMLLEMAPQREAKNIPQHLTGDVLTAILTGQPYPRTLLVQTIQRIRADRDINAVRIATTKAVLARAHRHYPTTTERVPVSLDLASVNTAYRLGRWFAVLERMQAPAGLGKVNATIGDRFYASASATPSRVFPTLIRNSRNHSKAIRSRVGPALAAWFEGRIAEIASGIGEFPRTLSLEDQGQFALGLYHQRGAFARKAEVPPDLEIAETIINEDA
jgi:CRISPR-associated protein Csd1